MKKGKPKNTKFHGILATGHTQEEAANQYRLLALGKGVEAKVDASRALAFVTTAGAQTQLFNPRTGELDLQTSKKILAELSFEANASGATVVAQHYQCTAGCGQHFVYDSKALMKFCPVCVSAVTAATEAEDQAVIDDQHDEAEEDDDLDEDEEDDEDEADLDDEIDDETGDDDLGDEDDDDDEDDTSESSDDEDEDDEDDESEDDEDDSESSDDEDDDTSESSGDNQPLIIAADSRAHAVKILRHEKRFSAEASASVNYMVCASAECGAHVLAEEDGVTACPSCKSTLIEPPAPASLSSDDEDEDEEDDDLGIHDDDDDAEEDDDEDDTSESSDDEDEDDESEDEDDEDDEDEDDTSESSGAPAKSRTLKSTSCDHQPAPAAVPAPGAQVAAPQGSVQVIEGDTVKVDVLAQVDDTVPEAHKDLDLSFSAAIAGAAQWIASFKGVPVATARVEDAGDNKEIFGSVNFGHAVIAGAQHLGVKATLKEMGFRPILCSVVMPDQVRRDTEAAVAEARAQMVVESSEHAERLMAALATAAIGINRGFFQGVANPLKSALYSALSAGGIKQPEVLIDNAFKANGDAYHKVLFAQANELMANAPEVQESLSKAILGTSYQAVASSAPDVDSFESRLGGMGTVTAAAAPIPTAAPTPTAPSHVSEVVAGLGRRR